LATSNVVLFSNVTETESGGVAGALKGLFGGKKDKAESTEEEDVESETASASAPASTKSAAAGKKEKIAIKFREEVLGVKAMTGEDKRTTQARLASASCGHGRR
jgi:hypoxia up-regulated 1